MAKRTLTCIASAAERGPRTLRCSIFSELKSGFKFEKSFRGGRDTFLNVDLQKGIRCKKTRDGNINCKMPKKRRKS